MNKLRELRDSPAFWIAFIATLILTWGNDARAEHDSFWYAFPMPQAYLYVADPLQYSLWSAHYGDQVARSPGYRPIVVAHDRSRFRRRACEVRILNAVR